MILGRFNFLSVKPELYNVLYTPKELPLVITVIATDLSRDVALALIRKLNRCLEDAEYDMRREERGEDNKYVREDD